MDCGTAPSTWTGSDGSTRGSVITMPVGRSCFGNLDAVVGNYYSTGVRRFAIAGALATTDELSDLRNVLSMPVTVVRLTAQIDEIEHRLGSAITAGRKDDLRVAKEWIAANRGEELGGLVVANDGPIRDIALGVVSDLGWLEEHERRWDIDERGVGIATGAAFAPNVDELRQAMRGESWVAEDAEAHLMPHIRAACDADGSHVVVLDATVLDAVLVVDLRWVGRGAREGPTPYAPRCSASSDRSRSTRHTSRSTRSTMASSSRSRPGPPAPRARSSRMDISFASMSRTHAKSESSRMRIIVEHVAASALVPAHRSAA